MLAKTVLAKTVLAKTVLAMTVSPGQCMLTAIEECDGERVLTLRIDEATVDAEHVGGIESVLDDVSAHGIENIVFQFSGGADSVIAEFPSWQPGPARSDMRYFARWDETAGPD